MDEKTVARFWSKVEKTPGCWLWRASTDGRGYGSINIGGKLQKAPRVAFFLTHGHWPTPCVLHSCDNPPCVNPEHLREGGQFENSADRERRRRGNHAAGLRLGVFTDPESLERAAAKRRGMKYGRLTEEAIPHIRSLAKTHGADTIGKRFGVSASAVRSVLIGRTWAHVK